MSPRFLLDTNMVSIIVSGKSPAARATLASLENSERACVSAITAGELRFGVAKWPEATTRSAAVDLFLRKMRVLPWSHEEASVYGPLRADLEAIGETLGSLDLLIAAHALAVDAVLVTHDAGFSKLRTARQLALRVVDWATDLPGSSPKGARRKR